ncbi:MAG: sigma-70 family RNA polymerase sigma factor [Thermoanaerobaculia bacterium]|nr:sigma-70 family RNA polymerase sigma factor [Thermoanaerobaculia bacterium]
MSEDDALLLARVASEDRRAFEVLYRRYYPRLFGYVQRVCRRSDLVEEVVADVLLTVWRSAARFDGRSRVSTWIFGIAYRKTLKALSLRNRREDPLVGSVAETLGVDVDADRRIARRELRGSLERALAELSVEQRAVIELAYFRDLSCAEIAAIVGAPVNTVKTRMFHARRRLRELLPALGVSGAEAG